MKKIFLSILFIVVAISQNCGQQQAVFSLYNQFEGIYNPSAIPSEYIKYDHNFIIGADARSQWTNLPSAPRTQFLKGEYITSSDNTFNLLMGGYIMHDKAGPVSTTGTFFRLAGIMSNYDPKLGGLSAGLQLGAIQYSINTFDLHSKYPNDILTAENVQATKPQLSLGVSYYNSFDNGVFENTRLNTGISITHLGFNKQIFKDDSHEFEFNTNMHYYAYAKFQKEFYDIQALELNTWVRYVEGTPANIDAHIIFDVNEFFSLELGINTGGSAHGGIGLNLFDIFSGNNNLMHIGYSFNPSFLRAGNAFGNTHEVVINYSFQR